MVTGFWEGEGFRGIDSGGKSQPFILSPFCLFCGCVPPPLPRNHLAQEPPPGSAVEFSHHFFYQGIGFFMFLVDVGQLFRCAGHHFMCVATVPPIRGDPISHSQAHIPLKPLSPALDPFPEATSP